MARWARRTHSPAFKANVALAAVEGEKAPAGLARQFDVTASQIMTWKVQLRSAQSRYRMDPDRAGLPAGAPLIETGTVFRPCRPPLLSAPVRDLLDIQRSARFSYKELMGGSIYA